MTPHIIQTLVGIRVTLLLARILLTLMFWTSGLAKLFDFQTAMAEMSQFNLSPASPIALAVIAVQLIGSALVISGRYVWLGAGMLGVFTVWTIPIAHDLWAMAGEKAFIEMLVALEHMSVVGALILVASCHPCRDVSTLPAMTPVRE